MSDAMPKVIRYAGARYVIADEDLEFMALDTGSRELIQYKLKRSGLREGTPEYEELKEKLIQQVMRLNQIPFDPRRAIQPHQRMQLGEAPPDLKDPEVAEVVKFVLGSAGITVEQICALGDSLRFLCEAAPEEDNDE